MSEEEEKNEAYQNADILYEDDDVIFVQVYSLTAAKYFGPEFLPKRYNYYSKGELYVIYDKKKNIHFVIHKINDSSLSYLDGFEFDVSVSDIEKRYPMLEDKITDIVGVSSIYGALVSILNGKEMTEYELKRLDDTIYKFRYNEKNPGKSIIELKFDREEYFSLFDLDEYDQNFLNMVFDGRSYYGDNIFYYYDTADEDFREGYVMRDFNEENLNKVNEIMSLLRPDINKKEGDDTFFDEASKELYNNFNRQVDYITSEYADMREECTKEGFIEDVTKDLSDPFMSYGIFEKTPMSLYVTTVKILISLMEMARQKNGTIKDALMYVTKSMSVGPYEEYRYEYYCNDPDDSSFQRMTERKLDEILEKLYDSDMFVDIEEYREIISKVLSKYPIKQTIKLPSKKDQNRFFEIEKIDPKTNRIILTYGNYTGLQGKKEKRSYSLDEFFVFLTTPELFEHRTLNFRK